MMWNSTLSYWIFCVVKKSWNFLSFLLLNWEMRDLWRENADLECIMKMMEYYSSEFDIWYEYAMGFLWMDFLMIFYSFIFIWGSVLHEFLNVKDLECILGINPSVLWNKSLFEPAMVQLIVSVQLLFISK